jgi:hypothetical protein
MNTKMLDDAINGIRPELIEEAGNINQHELKNNDAFDGEVHVQGVEIYHRPIWKNILAIASALIIVGGAVTGGAFIMKNRSLKPADTLAEQTTVGHEAEETTIAEAEEITEAEMVEISEDNTDTETDFIELQLHETPCYVDTIDEAHKLQDEHSILIQWDDRHRYRIDVKHYAELLLSDGYDINSLEAKSFIYHMMCNSYLYFDTVKGTIITQQPVYSSGTSQIDFQVDLEEQESYSKLTSGTDGTICEKYVYDDKSIDVYYSNNTYNMTGYYKELKINLPDDNFRHIDIAPPDHGLTCCPSCSIICGGMVINEIMPEQIAVGWLNNFDNWQINDISERIGKNVVELSGISPKGSEFTIAVDIYTGIILAYTESKDGTYNEKKEMTSLEIDCPIERVEFDTSGFNKVNYFVD